jgi:hypothetical protein
MTGIAVLNAYPTKYRFSHEGQCQYRNVYEPDAAVAAEASEGESLFTLLTCEEIASVPAGQFTGHAFGSNTPTSGAEGGGTAG